MFAGFTEETFSYFTAIRFCNNREFFLANHDWYVRAVREPLLDLAEALGDTVRAIDPELETRPSRVLCRPNRDIRYSRDKSVYRDYMFLKFRRPGEERASTVGLYFDISDGGASFGAGFYQPNMPRMNALRTQIRLQPALCEKRLDTGGFTLVGNVIKRMRVPEPVPQALRPWYPLRSFYVEKEIRDFDLLKSPALAGEVERGFRRIAPMVQFLQSLIPEENDSSPKED